MKLVVGSVNVKLRKFPWRKNIEHAQFMLDNQIMNDMQPYMPMDTGMFINNTRARSVVTAGSGMVCAGAGPMGQYLYYGVKMVDSQTGKGPRLIPNVGFRFMSGAVLRPTNEPLTYQRASATPKWFEVAKQNHGKQWVELVSREVKNG